MLYKMDGKRVYEVPHRDTFNINWNRIKSINPIALEMIIDHIQNVLSEKTYINTSFEVPSNWNGSVFQPIFDMIQDEQHSAYFYGQIFWKVVMDDNRKWMFKKSDVTQGTEYFLPSNTHNLED